IAELDSILVAVKNTELAEISNMPGEKILRRMASKVKEWKLGFVAVNQPDYEYFWKKISSELIEYFESKPSFPNTPDDFEQLLAVALFTQSSLAAMNLATVCFREMIGRSESFKEALKKLNEYKFLPGSILQEGLEMLMEKHARSKKSLETME